MKLLLDQGLPRSSANLLRDRGIDAVHAGEIGYATADDAEILEKGRLENYIVVTLDADFHALLALSGASSPSVIRIRIQRLQAKDVSNLLLKVISEWNEPLQTGAVISVQQDRIRFRYLPL